MFFINEKQQVSMSEPYKKYIFVFKSFQLKCWYNQSELFFSWIKPNDLMIQVLQLTDQLSVCLSYKKGDT